MRLLTQMGANCEMDGILLKDYFCRTKHPTEKSVVIRQNYYSDNKNSML
jgi:hypothetical protein